MDRKYPIVDVHSFGPTIFLTTKNVIATNRLWMKLRKTILPIADVAQWYAGNHFFIPRSWVQKSSECNVYLQLYNRSSNFPGPSATLGTGIRV